jgi:hypothetical protein
LAETLIKRKAEMNILKFFKQNRKSKNETVETDKASSEQLLFAENALEILSPEIESFGFERTKTKIEKNFTQIIFRKENQYLKISGSTYPTDYPYSYNIILGEGESESFPETDWNSISLWRLKKQIEPNSVAKEYDFPFNEKVKFSLENAKEELVKFGITFLNGDLDNFFEARKELNKAREPYKIHSKDRNGNYVTEYEKESMELKRKYS